MISIFCQAQPQFQLCWAKIALISTFPHLPPRESTVEDISSLWNHPRLLTSDPVPFYHSTFVHATFVHATSVRATFVHATSVRATFFHTTFAQGQNLVVYNCNHYCLDQTIKLGLTRTWPTPDNAELGTAQPQLVQSLTPSGIVLSFKTNDSMNSDMLLFPL